MTSLTLETQPLAMCMPGSPERLTDDWRASRTPPAAGRPRRRVGSDDGHERRDGARRCARWSVRRWSLPEPIAEMVKIGHVPLRSRHADDNRPDQSARLPVTREGTL